VHYLPVCVIVISFIFNVKYVSVLGPKLTPKSRLKNVIFLSVFGILKSYRTYDLKGNLCLIADGGL